MNTETNAKSNPRGGRKGKVTNGQQPNNKPAGERPQVVIEEYSIPNRGATQLAEETWPFGELKPSVRDETTGEFRGPSFFIPESENPEAQLASARKRHKGVSFISRKMTAKVGEEENVKGVRVWRGPVDGK